jgi:hypothetical protein
MILRSPTDNENTDFVMPAWTAGIEIRKDASGDIHVDLDSSTPCWNDATAGALLELTEVRPPIFSKANQKTRKFFASRSSRIRIFLAPRRQVRKSFFTLRLCVFAGNVPILFGCGFAALGASWLRRDFVYQHGQ